MGKIITVEDVEIEFEKQPSENICNWCIYVRVRKKNAQHLALMIKTDNKPFTRFTLSTGDITKNSGDTLGQIMSNVVDLSNLQKELEGKNNNIIDFLEALRKKNNETN